MLRQNLATKVSVAVVTSTLLMTASANAATINTVQQLLAASQNQQVKEIVVQGQLKNVPSFQLKPGQILRGDNKQAKIIFKPNADGVELTTNNQIEKIYLQTAQTKRAIFNNTDVTSLGKIKIEGVTTIGQVQILAKDKIKSGRVVVNGLDVIAADMRGRKDRPKYYGVYVTQGAFTLWNMQKNNHVVIKADLQNISVGRNKKPVLGSGIFVSGAGYRGGKLQVSQLTTGPVYSDGKIKPGTADQITAGVFTLYGAEVKSVHNLAPVVTYGVNDMVLDNWGKVASWTAEKKLTSYGPSGIGFVNFGLVEKLNIKAPIETFGTGARGFNVYTGTVNNAEFNRIITHGNGAIGIQISQPIGKLMVHNGIETLGGTGDSLVKGKVLKLSAIGLSVKEGGSAKKIEIDGGIKVNNKNIQPLDVKGSIGSLVIYGGLS